MSSRELKEEVIAEIKELRQENEKLKERLNKIEKNSIESENIGKLEDSRKMISRRKFMKKAGLGAVGLGALMSPISALSVKDDDFSVFTGTNSSDLEEYFRVNQGGSGGQENVEVLNTSLDLNQGNIVDAGTLSFDNTSETAESISSASSTVNIDMEASSWYEPVSVTGEITVDITNVPNGATAVLIYFEDGDGSGPYSVDWDSLSISWQGGSEPGTIPADDNLEILLTTTDGGTNWRGRVAGGFA